MYARKHVLHLQTAKKCVHNLPVSWDLYFIDDCV